MPGGRNMYRIAKIKSKKSDHGNFFNEVRVYESVNDKTLFYSISQYIYNIYIYIYINLGYISITPPPQFDKFSSLVA